MLDQGPFAAPAGGVHGGPVVGQEPLGHAVARDAAVEGLDGRLRGLPPGDQGRHRQTGVVVDDLEDHHGPSPGQDVPGGVHLPARVGGGVDEAPPRRARPLGRIGARHPCLAEDAGQRGRGGGVKAHRRHLVAHRHRPGVQARRSERGPDPQGLGHPLVADAGRARGRTARARLEDSGLPLIDGPPAQLVERVAADTALRAERAHSPTGSVPGPPRNRQTHTRINRNNLAATIIASHTPILDSQLSPPHTPELSPMS